MAVLTKSTAPATPRQIEWIHKLAVERNWDTVDGVALERTLDVLGGKSVSKAEASVALGALFDCAKLARQAADVNPDPVTSEGMYRDLDGQLWRVVTSKMGNLYAKGVKVDQLPEHQWRTTADGDVLKFHAYFTYESGAIKRLQAGMRLSLDEAARLGKLWGVCIVCATELTDPESIAAGIGPVCARRV